MVHRVGPFADQAHSFVEAESAGCREGGVLAEAVAGAVAGFEAQSLGGVEHDQAGHEGGELGVAGVLQLVGVGVEEEAGDVAFGDLGCLVDELPALVFGPGAAHARPLRTLAGEGEGKHDPCSVDPSLRCAPLTSG